MAAYARTPSALMWLRVIHLINGLHKQISCKNCLYAVNSYFTLYLEHPCFSHGQLVICYISRVRRLQDVRVEVASASVKVGIREQRHQPISN